MLPRKGRSEASFLLVEVVQSHREAYLPVGEESRSNATTGAGCEGHAE